ncbi:MAG TPA: FtsX-like permease family protein [Opitutaceae bacterium]|nr:FtsX-like permease family protein [Opitutaceae bacterium]
MLIFGGYITYIQYGVQTGAVQHTGHFQIFRNGYFKYGIAAPGAWGIDGYQAVLDLIQQDPVMSSLSAVVTPIQSLTGIAGNFESDTATTFIGVGFVPSDRDRMKRWNEYGTSSQGLKRSGLTDDDLSRGITGAGLVRILGLGARFHLDDELPPSQRVETGNQPATSGPSVDLAELAGRDKAIGTAATDETEPSIDLLAATAGGAPNVVTLQVARIERQPLKELDDVYVGMNLGLAQELIYGRGEHKATGIVVQLRRTEDMPAARGRLASLFKDHRLDLEVRDFTELNPQYRQIIGLFRSIFSFLSVIIGIVVLFTVTNAMSMSVVERTGEIGTARAMGLRRQGVRRQFLLEGSLLGFAGATLGLVLASLVAYGINHSALTWTPPGQAAPVPLRLYLQGTSALVLLTWTALVAISTLAALVPANRAARMTVVEALRHV